MKSCDDVNEKQHDSNNQLVTDITTTTDSNDNNNSQSVSNASSLELLPKFTDLEQSIPFDNDDDDDNTKANNNIKSNKMIVTKSVKSSNCSPSPTCVTNQISNKTSSTSNIQSSNLVNHTSSSISSGNTVYKYKKNVIHPTTTVNNMHKTTINPYNKNTAKNSTKRVIKQQQQHHRIAMTEPPSVQGHSLANSRSVSAASSISNLKSVNTLNNESNIQPPRGSNIPKATSIQQISMESVYAALVKQDKSLMNQHSSNRTINTTKNNNTHKLANKTPNTGLYAKNTSSHRSLNTIGRSNHPSERLTSVEEGIPLTTQLQQSKHNYSLHDSNDCIPNALSCGNSTVASNTKTPDGTLSATTE
ncbi:unnamed protein product, partial [Schistosoma mattheei]